MARARRTAAVPTRAASRTKAMPICQKSFRAWITSRRQPSNAELVCLSCIVRGSDMAKPEDTLTLETTKGKVVIEMRPDLAPGHVARIKELVKDGFYDGIVFHRVIDGFMAQTGCPKGTGTGGADLPDPKAAFTAQPHVGRRRRGPAGPQGRVHGRAAGARRVLDGALEPAELGELAVLHLLRRRPLPR